MPFQIPSFSLHRTIQWHLSVIMSCFIFSCLLFFPVPNRENQKLFRVRKWQFHNRQILLKHKRCPRSVLRRTNQFTRPFCDSYLVFFFCFFVFSFFFLIFVLFCFLQSFLFLAVFFFSCFSKTRRFNKWKSPGIFHFSAVTLHTTTTASISLKSSAVKRMTVAMCFDPLA